MARTFTSASSHVITLGLGALGFAFGPGTLAAIIRPSSIGANNTAFSSGATNGASWMLQTITATGTVGLRLDGIEVHSTLGVGTNAWWCIAATKATGTATPRMHLYEYATGTWTHQNASGTLPNSSTPVTRAQIGSTPAGAAFWPGDIAMCGAWDVVLTDAQTEALAVDLMGWFQVQPKGLFILDQAATSITVNDLTGQGANQSGITGTAVSVNSVPVLSYGHSILHETVTAPVVAGGKPKTLLLTGVG